MSTYELDDADADYIRDVLVERATQQSRELAERLAAQIPIPVPDKVGAVVRTTNGSIEYVRWTYDAHSLSPWIQANNHEIPYRSDEIGRITEVLSPGVDL